MAENRMQRIGQERVKGISKKQKADRGSLFLIRILFCEILFAVVFEVVVLFPGACFPPVNSTRLIRLPHINR